MGIFSEEKPYTAVTNWIEQLCSEQYEEDDYTGVPDLCEVARIQDTGPAEAARAIRKKLKYGNVHRQVRALTLLDAILQNGDRRVKVSIANDEPLLERLRILVSDPGTDAHVKRKAVELFTDWYANFRNEKGMEKLSGLRSQMPTKKRQAPTVRPPTPDNDSPTGTGSPRRRGSSSTSPPPKPPRPTQTSPTQHKKSRSKSHSSGQAQQSFKPIDFAKERPAILETIAAGQQCATNLSNALKRLNRETQHPNDDPQILQLYRQCRKLRRDILNYIQRTESEEWIGTLINANEELVQALARYETALKPVEEDSDSDAWSVSDSDEERKKKESRSKSMGNMSSATSPISHQRQTSTGGSGRSAIAEDLAQRLRATSLSQQRSAGQESPPPKPPRPTSQVEIPPPRPPRPMPMQKPIPLPKPKSLVSKGKQPAETIATDDEDPFGDEHGIDTPAGSQGRKGWLEL